MGDPGKGPGGAAFPLIIRPNWGPRGQKKFFWDLRPPFSQGVDDRRPPPPPLSEGLDTPLIIYVDYVYPWPEAYKSFQLI